MVSTSRPTELTIEAHGVVKLFGSNRAVDGVDLAVKADTKSTNLPRKPATSEGLRRSARDAPARPSGSTRMP